MTALLIFIATHLMVLLSSVSVNTVSVAFPEMTTSLDASLVTVGWVLSIYLLVYTVSVALMGKICDIFGRKQVFLACSALFILGSLMAALSPNIWWLIFARLIQAVGGGGFIPAITGIITDLFPNNRQKYIGISISIFNIGGIIGPSVGAWLVSSFGWQGVFWFNVPFGILGVIPVIFLLKKGRPQKGRIDLVGAALLSAMLLTLMIGLSRIEVNNTAALWSIVAVLLAAAVVFLLLFLRHVNKSSEPIIDKDLIYRKPFPASNLYGFIFGMSVFGASSFIPLFGVEVYGLSDFQNGLVLTIRSIGMLVSAMAASFFVMRWTYRSQIMVGTIAISLTLILMGLEPRAFSIGGLEINEMVVLCIVNLLSGIANGIVAPALINCLIDLMPQRAGTITGLGSMFRQSGGAISIAIITVLLQSSGNSQSGFAIMFISVGILFLAGIPLIFAMPNHATRPALEKSGEAEK